ncbi:MAG TPA: ABC transporter permease [Anaerolineales bacterium]|nr:ABC transporter permease [Anaerolineales bacterium]
MDVPLAPRVAGRSARTRSFGYRSLKAVGRWRLLSFGVLLILSYVVVAAIGPELAPYEPNATHPQATLHEPTPEFRFGTDKFGRDIFSRVLYATRLDLSIAFSVAVSAFLVGAVVGALSGYFGGIVDDVVMRLVDVLLAFPAFILAMALTGILGDTIPNVILAISVAYVPYFIRLTRGEMLRVRTLQYADAAVGVGNPRWRVVLVHLLPNSLTPAFIQVTLVLGWAILDAAGLAFLGLGITPPTAEWGVMVAEGAQRIITGEWWTWLFPGLAIVIIAFAFSIVGDGLRDLLAREER